MLPLCIGVARRSGVVLAEEAISSRERQSYQQPPNRIGLETLPEKILLQHRANAVECGISVSPGIPLDTLCIPSRKRFRAAIFRSPAVSSYVNSGMVGGPSLNRRIIRGKKIPLYVRFGHEDHMENSSPYSRKLMDVFRSEVPFQRAENP